MSPLPHIVAHRGASAHAPENTMAAFRLAIEEGADGVEFDVRLARDRVPVVIHDDTLARTAARPERVCDLTSEELCRVDAGSWFNKRYPKRADPGFARETIPTLANVLGMCENFAGPTYIELKCRPAEVKPLTAAVCDVIRHSQFLSRIIVKSFDLAAVAELPDLLPSIQTAALFEPSITTILRRRRHIIDMAREAGAAQLSLHTSLATAKLSQLAADVGMPVTVWTTDDPRWIARCKRRGIGAIITNDPAALIKHRDQSG